MATPDLREPEDYEYDDGWLKSQLHMFTNFLHGFTAGVAAGTGTKVGTTANHQTWTAGRHGSHCVWGTIDPGLESQDRLLIMCHCVRVDDDHIKATFDLSWELSGRICRGPVEKVLDAPMPFPAPQVMDLLKSAFIEWGLEKDDVVQALKNGPT